MSQIKSVCVVVVTRESVCVFQSDVFQSDDSLQDVFQSEGLSLREQVSLSLLRICTSRWRDFGDQLVFSKDF